MQVNITKRIAWHDNSRTARHHLLTTAFVEDLAESLGNSAIAEVLPDNASQAGEKRNAV